MKKLIVGISAAMLMIGSRAMSQSTQVDISARLIGKPLQLEGFWIDDKLAFDAAGSPLKPYKSGSFTESGFEAHKVTLNGGELEVEGDRIGLIFNTEEIDEGGVAVFDRVALSSGSGKNESVKIQISRGPNGDYTQALNAIFATSLAELVPNLPGYWRAFFGREILHEEKAEQKKASPTSEMPMKVGGSLQPPKISKYVNASFSKAARGVKFSGKTLVSLMVDTEGLPHDIEVTRPAGLGLDEQAVKAVSQYRFEPARKAGGPVKVQLTIAVDFQILN
jgi:TonB family protein